MPVITTLVPCGDGDGGAADAMMLVHGGPLVIVYVRVVYASQLPVELLNTPGLAASRALTMNL